MYFPLAYKQSLWTEHIGEEFKTLCAKCNKELICFNFDIDYDKNKKIIFIHPKC